MPALSHPALTPRCACVYVCLSALSAETSMPQHAPEAAKQWRQPWVTWCCRYHSRQHHRQHLDCTLTGMPPTGHAPWLARLLLLHRCCALLQGVLPLAVAAATAATHETRSAAAEAAIGCIMHGCGLKMHTINTLTKTSFNNQYIQRRSYRSCNPPAAADWVPV